MKEAKQRRDDGHAPRDCLAPTNDAAEDAAAADDAVPDGTAAGAASAAGDAAAPAVVAASAEAAAEAGAGAMLGEIMGYYNPKLGTFRPHDPSSLPSGSAKVEKVVPGSALRSILC